MIKQKGLPQGRPFAFPPNLKSKISNQKSDFGLPSSLLYSFIFPNRFGPRASIKMPPFGLNV